MHIMGRRRKSKKIDEEVETKVDDTQNGDLGGKQHKIGGIDDDDDPNYMWTPYDELILMHSIFGLKPVGVNYHFLMLIIWEKFKKATGKEISISALKAKLGSFYNFEAVDERESLKQQFPQSDFYLPETDFPEIYKIKGTKMKPIIKGSKK